MTINVIQKETSNVLTYKSKRTMIMKHLLTTSLINHNLV